MMHFRTFSVTSTLAVWLCLLAGCLSWWAVPARALVVHKLAGSFGSEGVGPGQFKAPTGIAVNDSTHDVFVVDRDNSRVQEFDSTGSTVLCELDGSASPTGTFAEPTGIAVDNSGNPGLDPSAGDVYVVDKGHGVIDKFNSSCVYEGQLTGSDTPEGPFQGGIASRTIEGVAVDQSGTVWVTVRSGPIYSFSNALINKYASERTTAFGGASEGLGVDSEDNLYFGDDRAITKVNSRGEALSNPFGSDEKAFQLAVDPVGGEVYLDTRESIEAFSLAGAPIESDQSGALFPNFGSGLLTFSNGVAVDSSSGMVYVTDQLADHVLLFEAVTLPGVSLATLSEQGPRDVTLNGTVDPEGRPVTSCVFEYDTRPYGSGEASHGTSVQCSPASLGSGTSPVAVRARLEGLTPQTAYYYRLVAENSGGKNPSSGQEAFTGPRLGGEYATDVTAGSATLHAPIDPNGADTHYYVQYGLTTAYGSFAPLPAPGVDIGSAVGVQNIGVHLQGLVAGTVYHYRFVAVQDGESFEAPDLSFTTQSAGGTDVLADGRAWELVSPPNKKGALLELFLEGGQVQAASDGSGITYISQGPHVGENPAGYFALSQVLSRRGSDGWSSADLTLPGTLTENEEPAEVDAASEFEYRLFSPDLSLAAVEPQRGGTPLLSSEASTRTLYLRDNVISEFAPLVTAANTPSGTIIEEPNFNGTSPTAWEMQFLAATPDLGHVVFKTPMALTPEAIDEEHVPAGEHVASGEIQWNLYEWGGGRLHLINIMPDGEVAHGPISTAPGVRLASTTDANGLPRGGAAREVSSDGRRVAWTWGEPVFSESRYRGLYVRDMVEEKTVHVGGARAVYQTMNSDGSKIFYLENGDLYEFDFDTETTTDLTEAHAPGESAGVEESVSDVSQDGSYAYFVATGVLASGGEGGEQNLYVLHDTGNGWTTTHIATLSALDKPSWYAHGDFGTPQLQRVGSRVSPNGRYLVFDSNRPLTGYDNIDAVSGQPDEEVFVYDAVMRKLVCVSCHPTGERPTGVFDGEGDSLLVDRREVWTAKETQPADVHTDHWLAGSVPGWDDLSTDPPTYQPRYLTDNGRVFFDSPDPLVAQDTNGLEDVYEYEPVGVGSCVVGGVGFSDRSNGCVSLISSGTSGSESAFYDASESGDDVFFTTTAKLSGEDYDKGYDVYDAHVCTAAVPCRPLRISPPPCTSGDSCKVAPTPQPEIFGPAPSATFKGTGNLASPSTSTVRRKSLTNAQKLARALKACHHKHGRRRNACERQAHKHYPLRRPRKATATGNGG